MVRSLADRTFQLLFSKQRTRVLVVLHGARPAAAAARHVARLGEAREAPVVRVQDGLLHGAAPRRAWP